MKISKKQVIRTILIILGILLVIILGLYVGDEKSRYWIEKNILGTSIEEEDLPKIEYEQDKNIKVIAYQDYVAIILENQLKIYNKNGKLETEISINVTNPIFATNKKYLLIGDLEKNNLYMIYKNTLQWEKKLDDEITSLTITENGAVGVILTNKTYKSIISVYNITGTEVFKIYLSTTHANKMTISNDMKFMSFIEFNFSGTTTESKVKTVDVSKVKNSATDAIIHTYLPENDEVIVNIKYYKDKLIVLTDNAAYLYQNGNKNEIYRFNDRTKFADINLDGKICVVEESQKSIMNNDFEIKIIDPETKKENINQLKSTIKNINCYGDIIIAETGNEAKIINKLGWLIKTFKTSRNIKQISMAQNVVAIIYKSKIEILSI